MTLTLTDLPTELLQHIHLLALNPFLPCTNRYLHSIFDHPSAYYSALYLLRLYAVYGPNEILTRSLRHPTCTVEVAEEIKKIWDKRRGYVKLLPKEESKTKRRKSTELVSKGSQRRKSMSNSPSPEPPSRQPTAPALRCAELPRRLFRDPPNPFEPIHPLIKYLFENYTPAPNSHKGYPLFRAILTSNYELVTYLLQNDADPNIRDCFALDIAISMKDLKMVRLLVERNLPASSGLNQNPIIPSTPSPSKEDIKKGKKVKLGDRIEVGTRMVEKAIEKGSKEIINYFVYEKKVMPPLHSIMKIGKPDSTKISKHQKRKKPSGPSSRA